MRRAQHPRQFGGGALSPFCLLFGKSNWMRIAAALYEKQLQAARV